MANRVTVAPMRATLIRIVVGSLVVLAACGAPSRGDDDDDDTPPGDGPGGNQDNCSDEAKLIYVVDENNVMSTYDPTTKMFNDLGSLACPSAGTPFSMGIDRNAGAWVLFSTGQLFNVDTSTSALTCTETTWQPNREGLMVFGMGFSTDVAGGNTDTLFIAGGVGPSVPTSSLNTLNVATLDPTPVGTVNDWPELTGTGDAELWGFFPSQNSRIEKIDKTSGAALQTFQLPTLAGQPSAWAFAFFGGDFHIFLMKDLEFSTTVHQVNGQTGAIVGSTSTSGRRIVGAGVSTCAPTVLL